MGGEEGAEEAGVGEEIGAIERFGEGLVLLGESGPFGVSGAEGGGGFDALGEEGLAGWGKIRDFGLGELEKRLAGRGLVGGGGGKSEGGGFELTGFYGELDAEGAAVAAFCRGATGVGRGR